MNTSCHCNVLTHSSTSECVCFSCFPALVRIIILLTTQCCLRLVHSCTSLPGWTCLPLYPICGSGYGWGLVAFHINKAGTFLAKEQRSFSLKWSSNVIIKQIVHFRCFYTSFVRLQILMGVQCLLDEENPMSPAQVIPCSLVAPIIDRNKRSLHRQENPVCIVFKVTLHCFERLRFLR